MGLRKTALFLAQLEADTMLVKKRNGTGNGSPSVFYIVNYETYQGNDALRGNGSGDAEETLGKRLGNETNKGKKGKKEDPPGHGLTFEGYLAQFLPDGQEILRRTADAITSTRRTGRVALSVLNALAAKLSRYPAPVVLRACQAYLEKDHASQGKGEAYLLGIVRGEFGRVTGNGRAPSVTGKTPGQLAIERAAWDMLREQHGATLPSGQIPQREGAA